MKIMRLLSFLEIPKNAVPFATGYFWEFHDFLVEWKAMYPYCPKRGVWKPACVGTFDGVKETTIENNMKEWR